MPPSLEPAAFTLAELGRAAAIPVRTIRFYIESGLLPAPELRGKSTRYTEEHLLRLQAVRHFRRQEGLRLVAIQRRLSGRTLAEIRALLAPAPAPPAPAPPAPAVHAGPARSEGPSLWPRWPAERWERIGLLPGLELHLRATASPLLQRIAQQIVHDHVVSTEDGTDEAAAARSWGAGGYVECPARHVSGAPSLFLAGGITGCPDWQSEMRALLGESGFTILNPRRARFPIDDPSAAEGQIVWEHEHLRLADAILFWFAAEALQPIALYELGAWSMTRKPLFIGVHPGYERRRDVEIQTRLARPGVVVVRDLAALARQVLAHEARGRR